MRTVEVTDDLQTYLDHTGYAIQAKKRKDKEHARPEHGRETGDPKAVVLACLRTQAQVEIENRTRGKRVQRGAQV